MRIHNPLQLNAAPLVEVKDVNKEVTCLRALGDGANGEVVICTAGRDGVVNLVDARRGVVVGKVATGEFESSFCLYEFLYLKGERSLLGGECYCS